MRRRKPDILVLLVAVICLGVLITGFTQQNRSAAIEFSAVVQPR